MLHFIPMFLAALWMGQSSMYNSGTQKRAARRAPPGSPALSRQPSSPEPGARSVRISRTRAGLLYNLAETGAADSRVSESIQLDGWHLSETFVLIGNYANKQLCRCYQLLR